MKHLTLCVFMLGSLITAPASASTPAPPEFAAYYTISKAFLTVGKAVRRLKKLDDNNHYEYVAESKTTGVVAFFADEKIIETTHFTFDGRQVRPIRYHFNRKGKKNKDVIQQFNWEAATVNSQVNNETFIYPIPSNTLDQSVYQFSLMIDLALGKRDMEYHLAENKKLKTYPIKYLGEKLLDTDFGELTTVVIQRTHKKIKTTLWCAKALHYLPVKIEHNENGSEFTATLTRIEGMKLPSRQPADDEGTDDFDW